MLENNGDEHAREKPEQYRRFEELARAVLGVKKGEIPELNKKEEEYEPESGPGGESREHKEE